jgi:hypothetical protein
MKKLVMTLFLVLFTSSVYAGSCPMMAKSLDDKIAEAQTLRDQGMAAHDAGDHAKSEELLGKAMELFKAEQSLLKTFKAKVINIILALNIDLKKILCI